MKLSVLMITNNNENVIDDALKSVWGLADELLVSDSESTDNTREIVKRYGGVVFASNNKNLGERKQWLITKAKGDWILILDSDERVSKELRGEIQKIRHDNRKGYRIPYQNYVFGKQVYWGGERYSKVRLFRNGFGSVNTKPLHEEIWVKGEIGALKGTIHHYSYRTPGQLFGKFTKYAWIESRQKKGEGEAPSLGKLFLYAPHMFWARYIKEKGYKDGWRGLVLALAFSYMEGLTYWLQLV